MFFGLAEAGTARVRTATHSIAVTQMARGLPVDEETRIVLAPQEEWSRWMAVRSGARARVRKPWYMPDRRPAVRRVGAADLHATKAFIPRTRPRAQGDFLR